MESTPGADRLGGGRPPIAVPFARTDTGEAEAAAAAEVVRGGWLTTSDQCREFEDRFAEHVGADHAVALNSCTAALHLALEGLGVGPGDIVVTTPYTFVASAEVIRYVGATPVFVDIDPATFNIDCDRLAATLDQLEAGDADALPPAHPSRTQRGRVKAILPVHIGGIPCDLDRLYKLAASHDVAVVEDAAHAFPATIGTRPVGATTDGSVRSATCFSFYATKTLTTGEGGMLVTDDVQLARRARQMRLHGLSRDTWTRYRDGASWRYDIAAPGYKYNLTDIAAAIGLVQLGRAAAMTSRRTEIARRYDECFSGLDALETPSMPLGVTPSWHLYMLRIRGEALTVDRDRFIEELALCGVATSVHFIPLHLHSYYRNALGYRPEDLPVASREWEREISLPIFSAMTDDEVAHVCRAVTHVATRFAKTHPYVSRSSSTMRPPASPEP